MNMQGLIKMSDNNVQLTGILLFYYLMERFEMTASQAYEDMKEHTQDTKEVDLMFLDIYDMLSADGNAIANKLRQKHIKEFV
jgi:hypothetical protein